MYIIVTSKINEFNSEISNEASLIETYHYLFYEELKAKFFIYRIKTDTKIKITDLTPPRVINYISSKFLEKFSSIDEARTELRTLAPSNNLNIQLNKVNSN